MNIVEAIKMLQQGAYVARPHWRRLRGTYLVAVGEYRAEVVHPTLSGLFDCDSHAAWMPTFDDLLATDYVCVSPETVL